jgi:alanine racemase
MAVLKANAYGLGVRPIAAHLAKLGVGYFGVAEPKEAFEIDSLGIPILILGNILEEELEPLISRDIHIPVNSQYMARVVSKKAAHMGRRAKCHILVDTGMGRLGIRSENYRQSAGEMLSLDGIEWVGIYSHFPCAYSDKPLSDCQVQELSEHASWSRNTLGHEFQEIHIANSDGIQNIHKSVQSPFTMVRTGINLYGSFDVEGDRRLQLDPAISIYSRLILVRSIPKGSTIGYGGECRLDRECLVGTVGIGYADGLPIRHSATGYVLVRGTKCPILGRTSMDYTTVDLSAVPDAREGEEVVCLGQSISTSDWAKAKGTVPYEVICSIGNRVVRTYIDG